MTENKSRRPPTIRLNNINSTLPYLKFCGLKFLIDTGSTKTLINSQLYNHFREFAIKIPFKVKTAHGLTEHNDAVHIDIPDMFNTNMKHTFFKFDFSPNFDGLIGIDLLDKLEAVLDIRNRKLTTKHAEVPISMNKNIKVIMEPL